ncbi:hypothetical protein Tco_0278046 [Tanacetum coccineum]
MASNKDRIENLEVAFRQLQDGIAKMKIGFADKFQHLEDIITKLFDAVLSRKGSDNYKQAGRLMFYSKLTKLEFLKYRGDEDPTEWFTKVDHFFENQGTPVTQKVSLASYYLQGEANQWYNNQILFENIKRSLRGWEIEYEDGLKSLKDATSLARMRVEQLNRLSPITQASLAGPTKNTTMKQLTWDKMQKKKAKGGDNYKQEGRLMFYSKLTKLEFLTYHGDKDPTERFTKFDQFFKNQGTPVTQKVSLASYHLQGEANQWWRWLHKAYQQEEYQKEFRGWEIEFEDGLKRHFFATFMGGLKPEIADGIRMFKPTNLKDATSLARMRDKQLN